MRDVVGVWDVVGGKDVVGGRDVVGVRDFVGLRVTGGPIIGLIVGLSDGVSVIREGPWDGFVEGVSTRDEDGLSERDGTSVVAATPRSKHSVPNGSHSPPTRIPSQTLFCSSLPPLSLPSW